MELADCLILVRPPLRWTVWKVCWLSWLCWASGHENDDWHHVEHPSICYWDGHRSAGYRRQTRNQSTDTGCKVQKTPGPSDAWTHESANKVETKEIKLHLAQQDARKKKPRATGPYDKTHSISQNYPILEMRINSQECALKCQGSQTRGCQPDPEIKSLEYVNTKYPAHQWTHAYTDSSAADAYQDGGGGVYIRYNDGKAHITLAIRKYSTNFKAEAEALQKTATKIRDSLPQTKPNVVIFTDALCPQQTPKFLPDGSQWGGNCPGRSRSPHKPNPTVDSSTLQDQRK